MKNDPANSPITKLGAIFGVVFIVLKLIEKIDWSWLWVTSPFWIVALIYLILFTIRYSMLRKLGK